MQSKRSPMDTSGVILVLPKWVYNTIWEQLKSYRMGGTEPVEYLAVNGCPISYSEDITKVGLCKMVKELTLKKIEF